MSELLTPEALDLVNSAIRDAARLSRAFDVEFDAVTLRGNAVRLRSIGRPAQVDGRTVRVVGTLEDVTAQREAAAERQRYEQLNEQVSRLSGIGGWEFDLQTKETIWSPQVREIFEVGETFNPRLEDHPKFIAPESSEAVALARRRAVVDGLPAELEYQAITATGRRIWVRNIYQAERIISKLPQNTVRLPQDIRSLVEDASTVPQVLESGAAFFRDQLDQETRRMINTARILDVFNSSTYEDREGAKTRWNDQPTALLVLLRQPINAASTHLEFFNGERLPVPRSSYGPFGYPLALALHRNAIRIPLYLVRHLKEKPDWLVKHCSDAVLAVVPDGSTACELVGGPETSPYLLDYHPETGLSHTRNQAAKLPPYEPEEDGWF
jgi:PAS domain-containing protein